MMRQKPRGWQWESTRHGLAARGIKTSRRVSHPTRPMREFLYGGRADGMPDRAFDPLWLKKGEMHELEHTKDHKIAREIARDHLAEDPKYYEKLDRMEKGACDKRYNMTKERAEEIAGTLKGVFSDGLPESKDYEEYLRKRDVDSMRNDVVGKLDGAVSEGKITARDRQDFLEGTFAPLEREHLGKITTSEQFTSEVERKVDGFISSHDRTKGLFG
jgi:hypothetical protein